MKPTLRQPSLLTPASLALPLLAQQARLTTVPAVLHAVTESPHLHTEASVSQQITGVGGKLTLAGRDLTARLVTAVLTVHVTVAPEPGRQTFLTGGTQPLLGGAGAATVRPSLVTPVQAVSSAVTEEISGDTGAVPAGELGLLALQSPFKVALGLIVPVTAAVSLVAVTDEGGGDAGVVSVAVELATAALLGTAGLVLAIVTVHLAITDVVRGNTLVLVAGELSQQAAHIPTAIVLVTAVSLPAVQVPVTLPAEPNTMLSFK